MCPVSLSLPSSSLPLYLLSTDPSAEIPTFISQFLQKKMKIFSWVHRRFNNKAENVNKYGDVSKFPAESKCGGDDEAYERWGGGILAIGTFGYDPLKKDESEHKYNINDYFSSSSEEDGDGGSDAGAEEYDDEVIAAVEMVESWSDEEVQVQLGYEYMMMKKTERTTLADLFSADCKEKRGSVSKKEAAAAFEKPAAAAAAELVKGKSNRKSFANKLIAKDARPIQKLNKLMRRMLKRKIHPDVGPAGSKVAAVVNNNINISHNSSNNNCRATDDYASLLPTTTDTNI